MRGTARWAREIGVGTEGGRKCERGKEEEGKIGVRKGDLFPPSVSPSSVSSPALDRHISIK